MLASLSVPQAIVHLASHAGTTDLYAQLPRMLVTYLTCPSERPNTGHWMRKIEVGLVRTSARLSVHTARRIAQDGHEKQNPRSGA